MADTSTSAPTNYAEWSAAGGNSYTMPDPAPEPEAQEQAETSEASEEQTESVAEAEPAESEPEQEQDKEQPPAKPKRTLGSDHAKMLKEVQEYRRERRELQQQIEQMQQQLRHPAPAATQPQAIAPGDNDPPPVLPRLSTWKGTLEEFEEESDKKQKEMQAWTLRQWKKEQQAEGRKAAAEQITTRYQQRLGEHVKKHPEFRDEIAKTPVSDTMADVVMHVGPELAQLLIENKDEARRICGLHPAAQLVEMGRLMARLNTNKPDPEPEEEEPSQPVKVPAKLSASQHSTSAWQREDRGAKNYAEWIAVGQRLANGRKK